MLFLACLDRKLKDINFKKIQYLCFSPYNYDVDKVMNLSSSGQENQLNSERKKEESAEIVSIDKYFETVGEDNINDIVTSLKLYDDETTSKQSSLDEQLEKPLSYFSEVLENSESNEVIGLDEWVDFDPSPLIVDDPEPQIDPPFPKLLEIPFPKLKDIRNHNSKDGLGFKTIQDKYSTKKYFSHQPPTYTNDIYQNFDQNHDRVYQKYQPPLNQKVFPMTTNVRDYERKRPYLSPKRNSYSKPKYPILQNKYSQAVKSKFLNHKKFNIPLPLRRNQALKSKPFKKENNLPNNQRPYRRKFF